MRELNVTSERGGYRVLVGEGLLDATNDLVPVGERRMLVVTNVTVGPLHAGALAERLACGPALELPDGERFKEWRQVEAICREALDRELDRGSILVAVGGGVVTDLAGFAASVFLRGADWVAVPTTLLAMVDAAIGGKTGVNLPEGKNLVGTFWPPQLVLADVTTLTTLAPRELRAGLAEVVKAGWIGDRGILDLMPSVSGHVAPTCWEDLVARAAAVKIRIVEEDEREAGVRQKLNLGHTIGHALEAVTRYERFLHGEAVAWGMLAVGAIAHSRGVLSESGWASLRAGIRTLGPLPPVEDLDLGNVLEAVARDKKRGADGVAWVLPTDEGVQLGQRVAAEEVRRAWASLGH